MTLTINSISRLLLLVPLINTSIEYSKDMVNNTTQLHLLNIYE